MDKKDIRTLQILESMAKDDPPSQRDLAKELNISLGLVNSFIRRLAKKGYFKITHIPKNRIRYIMTSKGAAEKTKLTYAYIRHSYDFYRNARQKIRQVLEALEGQGVKRILLYGDSDLAEITLMFMRETRIQLAGIIDDKSCGHRRLNYKILPASTLSDLNFDMVLITSDLDRESIMQSLLNQNIPQDKIILL